MFSLDDCFSNPEKFAKLQPPKKKKRRRAKGKKEDLDLQKEILQILNNPRHIHGVYLLSLRKILGEKIVVTGIVQVPEGFDENGNQIYLPTEVKKRKPRFSRDKVIFNLQKLVSQGKIKLTGDQYFVELVES